jgi:hypothetical protein
MNKPSRYGLLGAVALGLALAATAAQAAASRSTAACADAWASYNDFKSRTVMEPPSEYAVTIQGAAVRAACGENALPVPVGSDRPPRHHVHRTYKPARRAAIRRHQALAQSASGNVTATRSPDRADSSA